MTKRFKYNKTKNKTRITMGFEGTILRENGHVIFSECIVSQIFW